VSIAAHALYAFVCVCVLCVCVYIYILERALDMEANEDVRASAVKVGIQEYVHMFCECVLCVCARAST
jgi:hypothetical protein